MTFIISRYSAGGLRIIAVPSYQFGSQEVRELRELAINTLAMLCLSQFILTMRLSIQRSFSPHSI
jgi:glutathione peroxidase-family protein